jgi:glutamine phosphoribosylpyrophosphate amidotransferase
MCGIIGFVTNGWEDGGNYFILEELMRESKIRGLHSFGFSFQNGPGYNTCKSRDLEPIIQTLREYKPKSLIYHNRYSTSGDFNIVANNQPIADGSLSVAVNGVISMKPKAEYEKEFGVKCESENDAEVLLRILEMDLDLVQFLKDFPEITCAMVYMKGPKILALRNNKRPLHYFKLNNSIYVISTRDIAERVFRRYGINTEIYDIPAFKEIDLNERLQNN